MESKRGRMADKQDYLSYSSSGIESQLSKITSSDLLDDIVARVNYSKRVEGSLHKTISKYIKACYCY